MLIFLHKNWEVKFRLLILIHIFGISILAGFILMIYACILINRDNKTERKLAIAKEIIKEQNEKIQLLESELDEIEMQELEDIIEGRDLDYME